MTTIDDFLKRNSISDPVVSGVQAQQITSDITYEPRNTSLPHVPEERIVDSDIYSGEQLQASSISKFWGDEFDPYHFSQIRNVVDYSEYSFFTDYKESYMSNPFTFMVVESMLHRILGDGYHFEGPGANRCHKFFDNHDIHNKLEMFLRDVLIYGNGIMDYGKRPSKKFIERIRVIDPTWISVQIDIDIESDTYDERVYYQGDDELNEDYIFHFMIKPITNVAWGMSVLRPNIYTLQLLLDNIGDAGAAIKRMAYSPIAFGLDLEGLASSDDKKDIITRFKDDLEDINSATNNLVFDKRHNVSLLGQGGTGKLLPVNDMMEPIIAIVLRNFGVPIGTYLQQGANKAIVQEQKEDIREYFTFLKRKVKREIENNLLSKITNRSTELVWNRPAPSTRSTQQEMKTLAMLYETGIIPREQFLDWFDIEKQDGTFNTDVPSQRTSHDLSNRDGMDYPNTDSGEE